MPVAQRDKCLAGRLDAEGRNRQAPSAQIAQGARRVHGMLYCNL